MKCPTKGAGLLAGLSRDFVCLILCSASSGAMEAGSLAQMCSHTCVLSLLQGHEQHKLKKHSSSRDISVLIGQARALCCVCVCVCTRAFSLPGQDQQLCKPEQHSNSREVSGQQRRKLEKRSGSGEVAAKGVPPRPQPNQPPALKKQGGSNRGWLGLPFWLPGMGPKPVDNNASPAELKRALAAAAAADAKQAKGEGKCVICGAEARLATCSYQESCKSFCLS
eukprot:712049-Pelagomonas_calceolata.AAC.1